MMTQQAFLTLSAMLNAFPMGSNDPDLLLKTYEAALAGIKDQAVIDAAWKFMRGDVAGQNRTFAPSVPEFVAEARNCQEILEWKRTPGMGRPVVFPSHRDPPYIRAAEKKLAENAHLPVIKTNVSYDEWCGMSKRGEVPVGGKWVAALGIVYGPDLKAKED